jgi:hypothetical protein
MSRLSQTMDEPTVYYVPESHFLEIRQGMALPHQAKLSDIGLPACLGVRGIRDVARTLV